MISSTEVLKENSDQPVIPHPGKTFFKNKGKGNVDVSDKLTREEFAPIVSALMQTLKYILQQKENDPKLKAKMKKEQRKWREM